MSIYCNSASSTTINNLIQHRARAINSIAYSQTTTTFIDYSNNSYSSPGPDRSRSPLFTPISPALSSPSLYSRVGHSSPIRQFPRPTTMTNKSSKKLQVLSHSHHHEYSSSMNKSKYHHLNEQDHEEDLYDDHDDDNDEEDEDDDPRRMSMVGGPKVRKYTQVPWEEENDNNNDNEYEDGDGDNQWSMISTSVHPNSRSTSTGVTVVGSADMFSGFSKHANKMINNVVFSQSNNNVITSKSKSSSSSTTTMRQREISTTSTSTILSNSNSDNLSTDNYNTHYNKSSSRRVASSSGNSTSTSTSTSKHLYPSASGLSLASNQTTSSSSSSSVSDDRSTPITPKLRSTSNGKIDNSPTNTISFTSSSSSSNKILNSYHDYDDHHNSNISLLPAVIPKANGTYRKPISASIPILPNDGVGGLTLTPNTNTNKGIFAANDRPLLNSGSPGFGLISLEAAQERERVKSQSRNLNGITSLLDQQIPSSTHHRSNTTTILEQQQQQKRPLTTFSIPPIPDESSINPLRPTTSCTSTPSSPPTNSGGGGNRVKSKKSGLMRLFNKSDKNNNSVPPLPTSNTIGMATPTSKNRDGSGRTSLWSTSTNDNFALPSGAGGVGESAIWPSDSRSSSTKKMSSQQKAQQQVEEPHDQDKDKDKLSISTIKPKLELRPVSMTFSRGLPVDYMITAAGGTSRAKNDNNENEGQNQDDIHSGGNASIPPLPSTPTSILKKKKPEINAEVDMNILNENNFEMNKKMKEQILNAKKVWNLQLYELEAQIRELKDELLEAKSAKSVSGHCDKCGCTCNGSTQNDMLNVNGNGSSKRMIDRARVKTAGARGVFGSGSLYEWE